MILNKEEIIERINKQSLIENISKESIQPAGVDLRLDKIYRIKKSGELYISGRKPPEVKEEVSKIYKINPNEYCLCSTVEIINMPRDLVGIILPRSTLFRIGLSLRTALIDPGYKGRLILGLKNETSHEIKLERFSRICQVIFIKTKITEGYSGQYQGGII